MPIEIDMAHSILKSASQSFFTLGIVGLAKYSAMPAREPRKEKKQVTTFGALSPAFG